MKSFCRYFSGVRDRVKRLLLCEVSISLILMSELGEREGAQKIVEKLLGAGHVAYFAGGCVRDQLLGMEPKDYDIATSANPAEVQRLFPNADAIGAHFGVILVKFCGKHFEIATFRTDGSYNDGRRPESVMFSTPEEDARRRDFTVNGLFQDPISGEIIDYVEGKADLRVKRLRAIGVAEERFNEDALRLMRAVRFATVLDFDIEPVTWRAICANAHLLEQISIERIREEFNKILLSRHRRRGLEMLVESGLIRYFLPEVLDLIGCEQPPQWHPEGDVYTHTCIMLEMMQTPELWTAAWCACRDSGDEGDTAEPSLELALSVLLHDIGKPATYSYDETDERIRFNGHDMVGAEMSEKILRRMKYPKDTIEDVCVMVANHMNFMHVTQMKVSKLKRFMSRDTFEQEMELHRVDCASSNGFTENYDFLKNKKEEFANEPIIPPPLVMGRDLIAMGLQPGPRFKDILTAVETEQLEGRLSEREAALEWVRKEYAAL